MKLKDLQIINESSIISGEVQLIEESVIISGERKIKFKAKLQEANVVNNNKRIYSEQVLQMIVQQLGPKASERKLVGEMDHPTPQGDTAAKMKRSSTMSLQEACILFTKLEFDGKFIIAECETLTNDKGMNLYYLLKDKVSIGFSLRAFGSSRARPDGVIEVLPDGFKALTFDVVGNPSHSNAVIYEMIQESTDLENTSIIQENGVVCNGLICELKNYGNNVTQIDLISEGENMTQLDVKTGDQVCACSIDGSCLTGTIDESIDYLLSVQMDNIKSTRFKKFSVNI